MQFFFSDIKPNPKIKQNSKFSLTQLPYCYLITIKARKFVNIYDDDDTI